VNLLCSLAFLKSLTVNNLYLHTLQINQRPSLEKLSVMCSLVLFCKE
jgi:hypothetical protein